MREEVWAPIEGFPSYEVSNLGNVVHTTRNQFMRHSENQHGVFTVGLWLDGKQYRRSVKRLVAEAFVPGQSDLFDTPIIKNNRKDNLWAHNLAWRPRWFAHRYSMQFLSGVSDEFYLGPVIETETGDLYLNSHVCGMMRGLLFEDIWMSARNEALVFPSGCSYDIKSTAQPVYPEDYPPVVKRLLYSAY